MEEQDTSRSLGKASILPPCALVSVLLATCLGAEEGQVRGGALLQKFLDSSRSYVGLPARRHTPAFRLAPVEMERYKREYQWIVDGRQKIGLLNLFVKEIEMFRFFPPEGGTLVEYRMPEVHHWATLQGPRIILNTATPTARDSRISYPRTGGETLEILYEEEFGGKTRSRRRFTLRYDPVIGYVWDCSVEMVMERPQEVEYSNLLAGGLADSRWEHKRYQKCVWTRRNGRLAFMYQNPFSLMHGHGPEWADLAQGGFMGFLADPVANPFIEVLESSPATTLKTCSVWYDQHIIARAPERPEADGLYHVRARYRLVGLPLAVAKELEDAARDMLPATGGGSGFVQGVVNDYESDNIPPGTLSVGCIWRGGAGGVPDKTEAHSGSVSIRMQGKTSRMSMGGGPPIYLETRNRYRLSVWAKTKGVRGKGFSMRLDEIFWSENDIKASHESKPLTGDQDWTKLEVVFDPVRGDPLAVLYIRLDEEGRGTAWFDDLELMEVAR